MSKLKSEQKMNIHNLVLGEFETNSYVLTADDSSKDCVIIDAGLDAGELVDYIKQQNLNPVAVILTHGHADHIVGLRQLRRSFPEIEVVISQTDSTMLTDSVGNLSSMLGRPFTTDPAQVIIGKEQKLSYALIDFDVIFTPGHTPGGISLHCQKDGVVFVGDTLFAGSVGRTDFPGGDAAQLVKSIKEKLLCLDGTTRAYPGHGPMTTISLEKNSNPFLR